MISIQRVRAILALAVAAEDAEFAIGGDPGDHPCETSTLLLDPGGDTAMQTLIAALQGLSDPERADIDALVRIGRGDAASWEDALRLVSNDRLSGARIAHTPFLATYLEDALVELGLNQPRYEVDLL